MYSCKICNDDLNGSLRPQSLNDQTITYQWHKYTFLLYILATTIRYAFMSQQLLFYLNLDVYGKHNNVIK